MLYGMTATLALPADKMGKQDITVYLARQNFQQNDQESFTAWASRPKRSAGFA